MSLINEALKRTRDASYQPVSTAPPAALSSYRAQSGVETSGSRGTLLITILVAAIAVAGSVGLALHLGTRVRGLKSGFDPSTEATPSVPQAKQSESRAALAPGPIPLAKVETVQTEPAPSVPAVDPKIGEDELVARVMEKIKAEQAAAAAATPKPPKFILQGITYARDGSEAMINGLGVREGEDIGGARVVAIDRHTVKLDCDGREIVLRLP
jgi:hypothetical protein